MGRPCLSCASPRREEIDRKLRSGSSHADVARWLLSIGETIAPRGIGNHANGHLGVPSVIGRRPVSGDFLEAVRDGAHERLAAGDLAPSLKDGISAQRALDERMARGKDQDLMIRVAIALTGPRIFARSPEVEAIEAKFRPLLDSGAE